MADDDAPDSKDWRDDPSRRERVTTAQLEVLADIFANTERADKIGIVLDPVSRTVTVSYEDLDDEWFRELVSAGQEHAQRSLSDVMRGLGDATVAGFRDGVARTSRKKGPE